MNQTVRYMQSPKVALLIVMFMVSITCFVAPQAGADNISVSISKFSDDSSEFNVDFTSSLENTKHSLSIQSGMWLDSATMKISTMDPSQANGNYPANLTLDVGGDGSPEWMFKGVGYGQFGRQNVFSNGKEQVDVMFKDAGSNNSVFIRLPKTANVKSAQMNMSGGGPGNPGWALVFAADYSGYVDAHTKLKNNFPDDFKQVDLIAQSNAPTLETLCQYQSVLVYSDLYNGYSFNDYNSLGNVLADYIDLGGGVVLGYGAYYYTSYGIGGRFQTDNYYVMPYGTSYNYYYGDYLGSYDSSSPLMENVNQFYCYYMTPWTYSVNPGATVVAQYTYTGRPLVAEKYFNGNRRVDLGFYPASSDIVYWGYDSYYDGDQLIRNAMLNVGVRTSNVTLDILNDTSVEFHDANMASTVTLPDFAASLNTYLASAPVTGTDAYGTQYVDVPINVTLGGAGRVSLAGLNIKYDYNTTVEGNLGGNLTTAINELIPIKVGANNSTIPLKFTSDTQGRIKVSSLDIVSHPPSHKPMITSFEPSNPQVMDEASELSFTVNAIDIYGNPLTYQWQLDGVALTGETETEYTLRTGYNDSGEHTLTMTVMNGLDSIAKTWNITVQNINRAPVIDSFIPADNPTVSENVSVLFKMNASDPDKDPLTYGWAIDGVNVAKANSSAYMFTGDFASAGEHSITAIVTDPGNLTASKSWKLTIENTDVAPYIVDYQPRTNPKIKELDSVRFSVVGTDPDNQSVSATWYADGTQAFVGTTYTFKTDYTSAGNHEIKVVVSDGLLDVNHVWTVAVENVNRLPTPVMDSPTTLEYLAGDVVKFSAKSSSDPDKDPLNFTWKEDTVVLSTQTEFERTFAPGIHTITLYALDSFGGMNSTTVRFRVRSVEVAGIIGLDRLDLNPGVKVNIIATLSNIGDANASNVNVEVLVDGVSLGSKSIAQLNAGSAQRETFAWKANKVGNHTVVLKVGEKSWQRTVYVEAANTAVSSDSGAGTNEAIGMMLIVVVMVVLLAFGFMMMRRK
jgi:hypothetical protein